MSARHYRVERYPLGGFCLVARPRHHVHYTPTCPSWPNWVETWFGIIKQCAIRQGTFRSVRYLTGKIEVFVGHYNKESRPFVWWPLPTRFSISWSDLAHVFP